jgi:hypothetical protein
MQRRCAAGGLFPRLLVAILFTVSDVGAASERRPLSMGSSGGLRVRSSYAAYHLALDQAALIKPRTSKTSSPNLPRALKLLDQIKDGYWYGPAQLAEACIIDQQNPQSPLIRECLLRASRATRLDLGEALTIRATVQSLSRHGPLRKKAYIGYIGIVQSLPCVDFGKYIDLIKDVLAREVLTGQEIETLGSKIRADAERDPVGHPEVLPSLVGIKFQELALAYEHGSDRSARLGVLGREKKELLSRADKDAPTRRFLAILDEAMRVPTSGVSSTAEEKKQAFLHWYTDPDHRKRFDDAVENEPLWKALRRESR